MKAVILTANKNENFFPFSETRTKSMIPCSGNFLLGRLIQQLKTLSVTNICIVVGYQKNLIQGCFEYGQKFGVELHYEIQKGKGIGNALLSAEKYIAGEKFLLVYGDILTTNKHVLSFKPFLKRILLTLLLFNTSCGKGKMEMFSQPSHFFTVNF